jgi:hypothetical protein
MRRPTLALSAISVSAGVALLVSLFVLSGISPARVSPQSAVDAQYHSEDNDYPEPPQEEEVIPPRPSALPEVPGPSRAVPLPPPQPTQDGGVSEGSVAEARAPAEALADMEPPEPYSQTVDNASPGRFVARGWKGSDKSALRYGDDYRYVEAAKGGYPARFKVEIPATDRYTVYARWPAAKRNNAATRFGVSTTSGIEWIKVDQRKDGGMWVRLGAYEMEAGERYAVQVSAYRAAGRVVADAVTVVRGTQAAPPEDLVGPVTGQEVVERARNHIGTPYVHSPPGSCLAHETEDCSCLTSLVFGKWQTMDDNPVEQWGYGREVTKDDLRPGDLVFFKEAGEGYPITHVGIYSGRDNIIHASSYWGQVVERPMEHVSGYFGARRLQTD